MEREVKVKRKELKYKSEVVIEATLVTIGVFLVFAFLFKYQPPEGKAPVRTTGRVELLNIATLPSAEKEQILQWLHNHEPSYVARPNAPGTLISEIAYQERDIPEMPKRAELFQPLVEREIMDPSPLSTLKFLKVWSADGLFIKDSLMIAQRQDYPQIIIDGKSVKFTLSDDLLGYARITESKSCTLEFRKIPNIEMLRFSVVDSTGSSGLDLKLIRIFSAIFESEMNDGDVKEVKIFWEPRAER